MERYRHDKIRFAFGNEFRQMLYDQECQRTSQMGLAAILEGMNQVASGTLVNDRGTGCVKTRCLFKAGSTAMIVAQSVKRNTADRAEGV